MEEALIMIKKGDEKEKGKMKQKKKREMQKDKGKEKRKREEGIVKDKGKPKKLQIVFLAEYFFFF